MAGETISLPEEIKTKVTERRGPFGMGRGPPPGRGRNRELALASTEARSKFVQRTSDPSRYWIGVCLPPTQADQRGVRPPVLLAMTKSLHSGGLFFDLRPWIGVGFAAVLFSVLFWLPMVRSITKAISNVTHATEQIAQGGFDARVEEKRKDELGRLGQAINSMAARLAGFVSGQKRFLGDIAHELCSPIARIEVALGILEQKADEKQKAYVNDVREDVQHMSNLVNELLSFSKAALKQGEIKLTPVELDDLVRQVVEREAVQGNNIKAEMDSTLRVMAEPDLLSRALANLVRNAIRYGGADGQISIAARKEEGRIILSVSDNGPGVPEEYLQKIFDPFFRLDSSRSRETGGTGLGLAIVKTCVEACQGTVSAHNLKPSGLQVEICLTVAAE